MASKIKDNQKDQVTVSETPGKRTQQSPGDRHKLDKKLSDLARRGPGKKALNRLLAMRTPRGAKPDQAEKK